MFANMNIWIARLRRRGGSTATAMKNSAIELTGVNMKRLVSAQRTSSSNVTGRMPKSGRTLPRMSG